MYNVLCMKINFAKPILNASQEKVLANDEVVNISIAVKNILAETSTPNPKLTVDILNKLNASEEIDLSEEELAHMKKVFSSPVTVNSKLVPDIIKFQVLEILG